MIDTMEIDSEEFNTILDNAIDDIYKEMGYDLEQAYSSGEFETMFIENQMVDDSLQDSYLNMFYVALLTTSHGKLESANRAVEAGNELAKIATIYTVAYNSGNALTNDEAKKIMDPNFSGSGSYTANTPDTHFSKKMYYSNINKVEDAFQSLKTDISYTEYKDITITEYTSKWMISIDENEDGIFNEKDITVKNGKMKIANPDITVEILSNEEIEKLNIEDAKENSNGEIYKIVWKTSGKLKKLGFI